MNHEPHEIHEMKTQAKKKSMFVPFVSFVVER